MIKTFTSSKIGLVALTLCVCSCINLKPVNDFSGTSLKSIQNYENLDYSFTKHCLEKCNLDRLSENSIVRADSIKCDCDDFKKADKATNMLYQVIVGYFDNLQKISNNEVSTYKFDALKKALTEGKFGDVEIKKSTVESYSKIALVVSRAVTDGYRKKKVQQFVEEANEPIQDLTKSFQKILNESLKEELKFKKEDYFLKYSLMLRDATLSSNDRSNLIKEYYQKMAEIESKQKQIGNFADGLSKISEGHQQLYDNRDKMTALEFQNLITSSTNDIKSIISEFKKLK
jgi:hypothetical protein